MGGRVILVGTALFSMLTASLCCEAQVKYELYNEQGATAPCIGIGIGILLAKKCATAFEKTGFVREGDVGESGLTLGTGDHEGTIAAVAAGSAGAQAGLLADDVLVSVDGHSARPTPAEMVAQSTFGPRSKELHLKIRRNGAEQEVVFARVAEDSPPGPKGEGMLTSERPLINWRGQFAPCIGMGPTAVLAFTFCDKHFESFGFIRLDEFAGAGFQVASGQRDAAVVSEVDANSPAVKSGLKVGDEIVAVENAPLAVSPSANLRMLLFGRAGQVHQVVVRRGGKEQAATLTLAHK